uniref:Uncharacterized protein n=1 Tax=Anopheles culicifacies TaxID=139723 RepID=A0A182MBM2_9DIPT
MPEAIVVSSEDAKEDTICSIKQDAKLKAFGEKVTKIRHTRLDDLIFELVVTIVRNCRKAPKWVICAPGVKTCAQDLQRQMIVEEQGDIAIQDFRVKLKLCEGFLDR